MSDAKSPALANFERMLASGRDGALLRFSLGNEYLKAGDAARAVEHFGRAIAIDRHYTAAWKLYAKSLAAAGRADDAIQAYRDGIAVARKKGDRQAEKEMQVFVRRLEAARGDRA